MGLIRKSLVFPSAGLVRGSSKKQRVARAQLNHLRSQSVEMEAQTRLMRAQTDPEVLSELDKQERESGAKVILWIVGFFIGITLVAATSGWFLVPAIPIAIFLFLRARQVRAKEANESE